MKRQKSSRGFFINYCSNWLPEHRKVCLELLKLEEEGRISFFKEGSSLIIRDNKKNTEKKFGGGINGRN